MQTQTQTQTQIFLPRSPPPPPPPPPPFRKARARMLVLLLAPPPHPPPLSSGFSSFLQKVCPQARMGDETRRGDEEMRRGGEERRRSLDLGGLSGAGRGIGGWRRVGLYVTRELLDCAAGKCACLHLYSFHIYLHIHLHLLLHLHIPIPITRRPEGLSHWTHSSWERRGIKRFFPYSDCFTV